MFSACFSRYAISYPHSHCLCTCMQTLLAVIERGMKDGSQIIFERESEQNPNTIPGDVIATLRETPHPRFRRDGDDLHAEVRGW